MLEKTPTGRLRQLAKTHDVWNFGPMWHLPLAVIPFLIAWSVSQPLTHSSPVQTAAVGRPSHGQSAQPKLLL